MKLLLFRPEPDLTRPPRPDESSKISIFCLRSVWRYVPNPADIIS